MTWRRRASCSIPLSSLVVKVTSAPAKPSYVAAIRDNGEVIGTIHVNDIDKAQGTAGVAFGWLYAATPGSKNRRIPDRKAVSCLSCAKRCLLIITAFVSPSHHSVSACKLGSIINGVCSLLYLLFKVLVRMTCKFTSVISS